MIDKLLILTDEFIKLNKSNEKELKKYELIKKILSTNNCFFNMNVEYAYSILRDLNIPEKEIKKIYMEIID